MARAKTSQPKGMIRIPADLAEKLGWLAEFSDDQTVSDIVEPLIRSTVEKRFARIESRVEIIKAAREGKPAPELAKSK